MLNRFALLLLLAIALAVATACNPLSDDDAAEPEDEPLTAERVLSEASDRWDETNSLHFELEATGDSYLDNDRTIMLLSAAGDLVRPSSVSATARLSIIIATVNANIIVIEDDAWWTNLITGNWEPTPEDFDYNPARLFNPDDGLGPIMQDIADPELHAVETIEGRSAHRVTGTVTGAQIRDITAGSIRGENIDVTIWIAENNFEVVRLYLSSPDGGNGEPTTWQLTFDDHNQDVTIDAPI